jgi:hypothetical protein
MQSWHQLGGPSRGTPALSTKGHFVLVTILYSRFSQTRASFKPLGQGAIVEFLLLFTLYSC